MVTWYCTILTEYAAHFFFSSRHTGLIRTTAHPVLLLLLKKRCVTAYAKITTPQAREGKKTTVRNPKKVTGALPGPNFPEFQKKKRLPSGQGVRRWDVQGD